MKIFDELKELPSTPKDLRKFGWTLGIVFGLLAGWLFWRGRPAWPYLAVASGFFLFFGAILPIVLKPVQIVWMGFALVMGAVMSRVMLTILFVFILVPIGIITRIAGIDFMSRKWESNKDSYWTPKPKQGPDVSRYERQA